MQIINIMKREYFKSKNAEELRRDAKSYAKDAGIMTNPDSERFEFIIKGLLKNREKHGEIYCPCRLVTGNKKKDEDIICPCVFHRGEIELEGHCRCLFFFGKK
jgi:ferredoxin-thioredoxin reductase catalytic subunit